MILTGHLSDPVGGDVVVPMTTSTPMRAVAEMSHLLTLYAVAHLETGGARTITTTIEMDGRPIYSATFGKEPVKSIYSDETLAMIEEGFED